MGDTAGILGLIGTGASAGAGIAGSVMQGSAMRQQGNAANALYQLNAEGADLQAADAIARGERAIGRHGMSTRALLGAQRASAAGQGVSVRSGTPAALRADTAALSAIDDETLRMNAYKESMGYRMQGSNQRFQGTMAQMSGNANASNTLLAGGLGAGRTMLGGVSEYYRNTPPLTVPRYTRVVGDETFF